VHHIARSLRRLPMPAVALPTAFVAMALILRSASDASDLKRWTAGERATIASAAPQAIAHDVEGHAAAIARALGLADAASQRIAVIDDRFHSRTVDDITYLDARGRPIGLVRLASTGRMISAVRFEYRGAFAAGSISAAGALARATALATSLGLSLPDSGPLIRPAMNGTLWTVTWPRAVDGFPVDGDGVTVRVWRSGDIHSVSVSERDVARPARIIDGEHARAALDAVLPSVVTGTRQGDGTVSGNGLRWVAANDRYRPEASDAPASILRLAYVFEMRFTGDAADLVRTATFWIDAETGELIGGDILR